MGVAIEAEPTCRAIRGVHQPGSRTIASGPRGAIATAPSRRAAFLALVRMRQ
jgi:GTP cyclohydrolase I